MKNIKVAMVQLNTIVGDIQGNTDKIVFCMNSAIQKNVNIIIFPELTITGYPPEDLVLKPHFIEDNIKALNSIAKSVKNAIAIVGFINSDKGCIYNSAAVLSERKIKYIYNKVNLPNYGVFDEKRYFKAGKKMGYFKARGLSFALNICEDIWAEVSKENKKILAKSNILINISASPYHVNKEKERIKLLASKAKIFKTPILYCNLVGGQDELIFDGRSMAVDRFGKIKAKAKAFEEDILYIDLNKKNISSKIEKKISNPEEIYSALKLGVYDYVKKNNFNKVALGLSGGIDSALVACIAKDALGRSNVLGLSMPSKYSSQETQEDSEKLAKNLRIRFTKIPLHDIYSSYIKELNMYFEGMESDITEENLQARIRGNLLMAFSNKFGYLILNTGNKSETSVGYCTLYGDMAGGFSVIKDVPKGLVYELAEYINKKNGSEVIPRSIIERAPSAELKPDQKDQDSLPPYDFLDEIIDLYVEKNRSVKYITKKLKKKDIVEKVIKMIDSNEYKRRQSPPGIKITSRAFGKDRRMPITNRYYGGTI